MYSLIVYLIFCIFTFRLNRMSSLPRLVIWESEGLVAYLHPRPWTPGSVILESSPPGRPGGSIFHLEKQQFLSWLLGARAVSELLCDRLAVRRCALVSRPHRDRPAQVRCLDRLIGCAARPLHGECVTSVSLWEFSPRVQNSYFISTCICSCHESYTHRCFIKTS